MAGAPSGDRPSQSAPKARASSEQKSAAKRSGAKRNEKGPLPGPFVGHAWNENSYIG
jgi:hypothetical protein